jgi:nicotinamidase-related amidase
MKSEKALLVIDIQNDYFEGGKMQLDGSLEASLKAKQIIEIFRNEKRPVLFIKHISLKPDATFFLPDTNGAEIYENIKPIESDKIFIKHYPNSFKETDLLEYLNFNHVSDLTICGMMTHMCIDATTRAAKDFGFYCTLLGDACATKSLEYNGVKIKSSDVHNSFLAALNKTYANVISTEEYLLLNR